MATSNPITVLPTTASVASADLFYVVTTPGTTPTDKAVTLANLQASMTRFPVLSQSESDATQRKIIFDGPVGYAGNLVIGAGSIAGYGGLIDERLILGYNATMNGTPLVVGEAMFSMEIEANWKASAIDRNHMEWNIDTTATNGASRRWAQLYIDRDDPDQYGSWYFYIPHNTGVFNISDAWNATVLFSLDNKGRVALQPTIDIQALLVKPHADADSVHLIEVQNAAGTSTVFFVAPTGHVGIGPVTHHNVFQCEIGGSFTGSNIAALVVSTAFTVNVSSWLKANQISPTATINNGVSSTWVMPFYIDNMAIANNGSITNTASLYIAGAPAVTGNAIGGSAYALYIAAGNSFFGGAVGFNGTAPLAKPLLATGVGHTVDDVITVLQNYGLVKQS